MELFDTKTLGTRFIQVSKSQYHQISFAFVFMSINPHEIAKSHIYFETQVYTIYDILNISNTATKF